jgi:hypothetical protein
MESKQQSSVEVLKHKINNIIDILVKDLHVRNIIDKKVRVQCPANHSTANPSEDECKINVEDPIIRENTYILPIAEYVHFANISIQRMSFYRDNMIDTGMSYIETVYEMLGLGRTACSGKIHIDYNIDCIDADINFEIRGEEFIKQLEEEIEPKQKYINIKNYCKEGKKCNITTNRITMDKISSGGKHGLKIAEIAQTFKTRLEESNCKYDQLTFNSIAFSNKTEILLSENQSLKVNHANVLLVIKDDKKKLIQLVLYEPHGYKEPSDAKTEFHFFHQSNEFFITEFMGELRNQYNKEYKVEKLPKIRTSVKEGMQAYVIDNLGYCVLISAFWLYIVLGVFTGQKQEKLQQLTPDEKMMLFNNFKYVEECLYSKYEAKGLFKVLVNFSIQVLNDYLPKITDDRDVTAFYEEFENAMRRTFKKAGVPMSKKEMKPEEINIKDSDNEED